MSNIEQLTTLPTKTTTIELKKAITELSREGLKAKRFRIRTQAQWDILRNEIKKLVDKKEAATTREIAI